MPKHGEKVSTHSKAEAPEIVSEIVKKESFVILPDHPLEKEVWHIKVPLNQQIARELGDEDPDEDTDTDGGD